MSLISAALFSVPALPLLRHAGLLGRHLCRLNDNLRVSDSARRERSIQLTWCQMMELGARRSTITGPRYHQDPGGDGESGYGYGDEYGLLSCRPRALRRFASMKVFVLCCYW